MKVRVGSKTKIYCTRLRTAVGTLPSKVECKEHRSRRGSSFVGTYRINVICCKDSWDSATRPGNADRMSFSISIEICISSIIRGAGRTVSWILDVTSACVIAGASATAGAARARRAARGRSAERRGTAERRGNKAAARRLMYIIYQNGWKQETKQNCRAKRRRSVCVCQEEERNIQLQKTKRRKTNRQTDFPQGPVVGCMHSCKQSSHGHASSRRDH